MAHVDASSSPSLKETTSDEEALIVAGPEEEAPCNGSDPSNDVDVDNSEACSTSSRKEQWRNADDELLDKPITSENRAQKNDDNDVFAWDIADDIQSQWQTYLVAASKMHSHMEQLNRSSEYTKQNYYRVVRERDILRDCLVQAEQRLADVQRIIGRYTAVSEPVVASDGFTYERSTIQRYLDDCRASNVAAVSQQTKEPLSDVLVSNQSLKRLVELLKCIKTESPPTSESFTPSFEPTRSTTAKKNNGSNSVEAFHVNSASAAAEVNINHPRSTDSSTSKHVEPKSSSNNTATRSGFGSQQPQSRESTNKNGRNGNNGNKSNRVTAGTNGNSSSISSNSNMEVDSDGARLHPCVRVYGFCNYKGQCAYATYPYDSCLSHLKGKCRFGANCHESHIDFTGPYTKNT